MVPAAYVFLIKSIDGVEQVLLQLRHNTGYMDDHWAAGAAGHIERGETAFAAARREAHEELGIEDPTLELVTAMHRTRGRDPIDERIDFFFTSRRWGGTPRIIEPAKCADLAWFPLNALPEPVVPHELTVLSALTTGLPSYTTFGFDTDSPRDLPRS